MPSTPWTKKSFSVPSDRIPSPQSQVSQPKSKKGGKSQPSETPKSARVRQLELLVNALQKYTGADKDPLGGCFCQAREHSLSTYSSICRACGLILCSINLPQYVCPHCSTALLTEPARDALLNQLDRQIVDQLAKEERDRQYTIEEARKAAGAFPSLSGSSTPTGRPTTPATQASRPLNQTHKVVSLDSKTKKVTVSTYKTPSASPLAVSRAAEVSFIAERPRRVWENLRGNGVVYSPSHNHGRSNKHEGGKRRRQGKNDS
ncbi:hypothetical protein BD779DRAFT_1552783 [Infundibulicybe gibba]|nr:hypothetical protein BD779DRAFT_1552783 [Infundibulicybe gibba]